MCFGNTKVIQLAALKYLDSICLFCLLQMRLVCLMTPTTTLPRLSSILSFSLAVSLIRVNDQPFSCVEASIDSISDPVIPQSFHLLPQFLILLHPFEPTRNFHNQ